MCFLRSLNFLASILIICFRYFSYPQPYMSPIENIYKHLCVCVCVLYFTVDRASDIIWQIHFSNFNEIARTYSVILCICTVHTCSNCTRAFWHASAHDDATVRTQRLRTLNSIASFYEISLAYINITVVYVYVFKSERVPAGW